MWKVYVYGLLKQSEKSVRSPVSGGAVSFEQLHVSIKTQTRVLWKSKGFGHCTFSPASLDKHLIHIKAVCALFYKEIV